MAEGSSSQKHIAAYRSRVVTIGFHRHRVECSCGYIGPTRVVPVDAEKDKEARRHA